MQKVKSKAKKITVADDNGLGEMFGQLVSNESREVAVTYAKYRRLGDSCAEILHILRVLKDSPLMKTEQIVDPQTRIDFIHYCDNAHREITETFSYHLAGGPFAHVENGSEEEINFHKKHDASKNTPFVRDCVNMCDALAAYKEYFSNVKKLNHSFVFSLPGTSWTPLPVKSFNIKDVFARAPMANVYSFIVTVLHQLFINSMAVYENVTSPDVDVNRFSELIIEYIGQLKKVPDLHRCGKAFSEIENSLGLLKNNFSTYYRDSLNSGDNYTIMENFLLDVSSNAPANPEVTRQFNTIINFYRKKVGENKTTETKMA